MVFSVRELPGEIGVETVGVEDPTDKVVDVVVLGEGLMATLVSQDPESGHRQGHQVDVECPGEEPQSRRLDLRNPLLGHRAKEQHEEDVPKDKVKGLPQAGVEALLRDRPEDVVDGVVRSCKDVPVGVDGGEILRRG